ncbi:aldose 1-epimerase [Aquimarina sediminis]|uniref:aldose 1-epimerase n=1 Tax=Aquimarina sediminis TaxID=2070536 RepID=UPI0013E8CFC1|nr:aldose 1-epimerase [Aquimarina sediminis]
MSNSTTSFFAKICLRFGGSLQKLTLHENQIIKEFEPFNKEKPYASAILFPFTGRIRNGQYDFELESYQLEMDKENNTALHGFVYNKEFDLVDYELSEELVTVNLEHIEDKKNKGFPYNYSLLMTYKFTHESVITYVTIRNKDEYSFPFSLGWHPFFFSSSLYNSYLEIESDREIVFDNEMIPVKFQNNALKSQIQIKDLKLDDCYRLKNNSVRFITPDYTLNISSSSQENYLQVYTPADSKDCIAIELMTAPADSFNNKVGFKSLVPGEKYNISWKIALSKNN